MHPSPQRTAAFFRSLGFPTPEAGEELLYGGQLWDTYKRGGMSEEDSWSAIKKALPVPYPGTWQDLEDAYDACIDLDLDLVRLARNWREKMPLFALSNAGADLERRLRSRGIRDLFTAVMNSYDLKMAKPDAAIFRHAAGVIGEEPAEILFVDDKARNTRAAGALGFRAHVYTGAAALEQVLQGR